MPEAHLDVERLYAALDQQRRVKDLSWRQLAAAVDISPSTFTRMREGKRPDVDSFASLVEWLGVPAERFLQTAHRAATKKEQPTMAMIATYLRADKNLTKKSAEALEDIIRAAYERMKTTP
jgi:transcriptional regulator with XRE-family HTH domain